MKWIRLSAIAGIILLILIIVQSLFSFIFRQISQTQAYLIISEIVFFGILIFSIILYFGFIKIGKALKLKMLNFSSLIIIILLFLQLLFSAYIQIILYTQSKFSFLLYYQFYFQLATSITLVFFSIGIIKISPQIKYSKLTGILVLITTTLSLIYSVFFLFLEEKIRSLFIGASQSIVIITLSSVLEFIPLAIILLEILLLRDASKKLESNNSLLKS